MHPTRSDFHKPVSNQLLSSRRLAWHRRLSLPLVRSISSCTLPGAWRVTGSKLRESLRGPLGAREVVEGIT